jgi:RNA polymerase sigma-70 factor (ECF subfamily)
MTYIVAVDELVAAFVEARGEELDPEAALVVGKVLAEAVAQAREAWPHLAIENVAWIRAIAAISPKPLELSRPLGSLVIADHFVAFACGLGDPAAVAACDAVLVREAGFAADGTRMHVSVRDEATQIVREVLFAPRAERGPAIRDYAGRGPLRSWFRVAVSREMVRLAKAQNRAAPLEEHLIAAPAFADDPVLDELKTRYRTELANAFRAALDGLPARERTLLRYQLIDGLTIDEIGAIFRVHRATAARWLAKIRDDLVEKTRATMAVVFGVDTQEAASIVRLVQSQLDVSVIRHLGPPPKT